jgi:RNA polymerase sigma-70 factor, ECF subfamily
MLARATPIARDGSADRRIRGLRFFPDILTKSRGPETRRSALLTAEAEVEVKSLAMDEECFRVLYERTARPLWAYLARVSGDPALADDLLQECYCRFLSQASPPQEEAHRKNYLFRIATNLLRDHWRKARSHSDVNIEDVSLAADDQALENVPLCSDLGRALARLKPQERQLLWLAYAEKSSHREIAETSGIKEASVRPMLFRARRKLMALMSEPRAGQKSWGVES